MVSTPQASCDRAEHDRPGDKAELSPAAFQQAAGIFRAMGDPARLQILALLLDRPWCVTEIAAALEDSLSAVSQRLKLLRGERLVVHRRQGKHVYYRLADQHVAELVANGLAHAVEVGGTPGGSPAPPSP